MAPLASRPGTVTVDFLEGLGQGEGSILVVDEVFVGEALDLRAADLETVISRVGEFAHPNHLLYVVETAAADDGHIGIGSFRAPGKCIAHARCHVGVCRVALNFGQRSIVVEKQREPWAIESGAQPRLKLGAGKGRQPGLPASRRFEKITDPVRNVISRFPSAQRCHSGTAFVFIHRERAMDRFGIFVDVVGIDEQSFAHGLRGTGHARKDQHSGIVHLGRHELFGDQVHPVAQRSHECDVRVSIQRCEFFAVDGTEEVRIGDQRAVAKRPLTRPTSSSISRFNSRYSATCERLGTAS